MPIYEYRSIEKGCEYCIRGFDTIQKMSDEPLVKCPKCGSAVKRVISRFLACIIETPEETASLDSKLKDYEGQGMWSHAAELADKSGLEERALNNYKKAGYNF